MPVGAWVALVGLGVSFLATIIGSTWFLSSRIADLKGRDDMQAAALVSHIDADTVRFASLATAQVSVATLLATIQTQLSDLAAKLAGLAATAAGPSERLNAVEHHHIELDRRVAAETERSSEHHAEIGKLRDFRHETGNTLGALTLKVELLERRITDAVKQEPK